MYSLLKLACLYLPLAASVLAQEIPTPGQKQTDSTPAPNSDFEDLLKVLPEESLHAALKDTLQPQFQAGVFQHGRKAVEAVHSSDPSLATRLVIVAAKHGLFKRQNNSTAPRTTTSASPAPTVVIPIGIPTTDSAGRASTLITSRTVGATVIRTTDSAGSSITTTSAIHSQDDGALLVSSMALETSTLPDGSIVTFTSYAFVNPPNPTKSPAKPSGGQGSPNLQNGASQTDGKVGAISAILIGGMLTLVFL